MCPQTTRRYRTAKKIQATAIELAVREGLANVTTDAIARTAGISTRSFFNYYPYKEAAIMGPPPDYPADAVEHFIAGKGTLIDDLHKMITAHLSRFLDERVLMANVLALADTDPKLEALRNSVILARRTQMRDMMHARMPDADPRVIEILSSAIIAATNAATKDWAAGRVDDFIAAACENLALILPAAQLLSAPRKT